TRRNSLMMKQKGKVVELEQENIRAKKLELLADYAEWIKQQGFTKGSIKDHLDKLYLFWKFAEAQGVLVDGQMDLAAIDRDMMAEYQGFVFDYVSPKTHQKLKCNTQINYLSYVICFFRFLEKSKRINTNPANIIKLPRSPYLLPAVMLKSSEVLKLLKAPDTGKALGFRDRVILEILWSSAPRLSELLDLEVEDVNLETRLLRIREGKGQKERIIPLGKGACAWLAEYIPNVWPLLAKDKTKLLLPSRFSKRMDKAGWKRKLEIYLDVAGIEKPFTTHGFRHMLATEMLKNGADLRHIQQMLGHDSLKTTQRYLHIVKAELKKVHKKSHPREQSPLAPIRYQGSV
ncbi:MAG: tyrosine-type recombinase/integrase, partial [Verrucomicrobiota bacterium]